MAKVTKSIVLEEKEKQKIENYARAYGYMNSSELIRDAIRDKLKELENREPILPLKNVKQGAVVK